MKNKPKKPIRRSLAYLSGSMSQGQQLHEQRRMLRPRINPTKQTRLRKSKHRKSPDDE